MKVSNIFHGWGLVAAIVSRAKAKNTSRSQVDVGIINILCASCVLCQDIDVNPAWVVLTVVIYVKDAEFIVFAVLVRCF